MTDRGTDDGVAFEDLPDDSKCPRCEQNKGKFNKRVRRYVVFVSSFGGISLKNR